MSDIVITDGKFVEVFTDLISEYTEEIVDANCLETGEKPTRRRRTSSKCTKSCLKPTAIITRKLRSK